MDKLAMTAVVVGVSRYWSLPYLVRPAGVRYTCSELVGCGKRGCDVSAFWNGLGVGWRMALAGVCVVGLVACAAVLDPGKRKGDAAEGETVAPGRPPIDLATPEDTETATFALG
jgi:hypothetical protein